MGSAWSLPVGGRRSASHRAGWSVRPRPSRRRGL